MANPLKELDLKIHAFQAIREVMIEASPEKDWKALVNPSGWFGFDPDKSKWPKSTLELWPGGRWISESQDGSLALHAVLTLIEPGKLLRLSGPVGLSHLPVNNVFIFELQPKGAGQSTLLRFCQRTFGFVTTDQKKKYQHGWSQLLPQIKALAEMRDQQTVRKAAKKKGR